MMNDLFANSLGNQTSYWAAVRWLLFQQ